MNTLKKLWITITSFLFPALAQKRERQELANEFMQEIENTEQHRKDLRAKCRKFPHQATALDYLIGYGFDPTQDQMNKLVEIASETRKKGWKWVTAREVARIMTHEKNLAHMLSIGFERALEIAAQHNYGSIRVLKLPGRNELCRCGSNKKFKKCCLAQLA